MASSLWPSVSGAIARSQQVDIVANNLANADTNGFKKDIPTFKQYMASQEAEKTSYPLPSGPIKDKDMYPLDGRDQAFVVQDGTYIDFKPGHLRVTQAPLDFALDGPGFFEISTPSGNRYTRHGSFKLAMDGRLVTTEGYPVLGSQIGAGAVAQPSPAVQPNQGGLSTQGGVGAGPITLKGVPSPVTVGEQGEIYAGDQLIGRLSVVEFKDRTKLRKMGGQSFENKDPANLGTDALKTKVFQGVIETSNVNPVEEMTRLIQSNRMFEHDLKAIKTYNELLSKEANEVGKL